MESASEVKISDDRTRRRGIEIAKLTLLTVTPVLILVVLGETIATMSIARSSRTVVDSATGRAEYTLRIGKWPWSRVSVTPLNSLGYPDDDFPLPGSRSDCLNLVFTGDSFALGDGVNRDSNFVELVRRQTSSRAGMNCIRVFNLGVRGTTIDRQTESIMSTMDRLQPDVVILAQYQNDLTDLTNPGAILDPNRGRARDRTRRDSGVRLRIFNANLIKMLTYHVFGFMIRNGIARDELRHWSVMADTTRAADARRFQDTYARLYGNLVDTLRARGVAFGVVILPSKLDVLAKRYPEEAFFLGLAERHHVPALRLFPVLDQRRNPYTFLMYDGHLNEHGNRLVAAEIYHWLFETTPAPIPGLRDTTRTNRKRAVNNTGPRTDRPSSR